MEETNITIKLFRLFVSQNFTEALLLQEHNLMLNVTKNN